MSQPKTVKTSFKAVDHTTWQWKLFLVYDVLMMGLIIINLVILGLNAIILSDFAEGISENLNLVSYREHYIEAWAPWVKIIDRFFIYYLITELLVRWFIAAINKHHRRWFFFPFIHWYEVLAIIPQLRFLRLLRAGVIAYRLHELGYKVIPHNLLRRGKFYYDLVMEELTSRIVLTVIDGVEKELETSTSHHKLIHELIDHHRKQFAEVLAETLQESLATALQQQRQFIAQNIGDIVHQSIDDTPELKNILRMMPVVGGLLEQRIQAIGRRLAENITEGIIDPIAEHTILPHQPANPLLNHIAEEVSKVPLDSQKVDHLVESIVMESLEAVRKQVKVKHWQQLLDQSKIDVENQNNPSV